MAIKVYNTLTKKKEVFKPRKGKTVNLFACGPTVWNYIHIGNARTFANYDMIVRYLRYRKYKVKYIMNITDIDDRIIDQSKKLKISWKEIARKYEKAFLGDIKKLNVVSVDKYARSIDYVEQVKSQVKKLVKKGFGYVIEKDGVYFDLSKYKEYGKLSGRKALQAEDSTSRIDESINKRNKGDFCLWKFSKKGEPKWKFELGDGRPGWHIEDTAITEKEFGPQYDVHGGAIDLIFPHHEAEIAQMESITNKKPFVKYWVHSGFLNFNRAKMSKSLGNVFNLHEALKKFDGRVIRFLFLSSHYRMPLDFNEKSLDQAKMALQRIVDFVENAKQSKKDIDAKLVSKAKKEFLAAMDDDFDTPRALAILFKFIREANKKGYGKNSYKLFKELDKVLGILPEEEKLSKEILSLVKEREKARKSKDWKKSDSLREKIKKKGYLVEDSKDGYRIRKV